MNWRGRPLISYQVIVASIAATTTRTGLRVHAEPGPGSYPTGVQVSDAQLGALPPGRHHWHGDWTYTPRPQPPGPPPPPRHPARDPERASWAHPALTGLTTAQWNQLIRGLQVPHQAPRDAALHTARGGPPTRKPAGGHPPALTPAEQVLVTILRIRFRTPQRTPGELFGVVTGTIAKAEHQIRPLLTLAGHDIERATPIKTLHDLTRYASAHGIDLTPKAKPAC